MSSGDHEEGSSLDDAKQKNHQRSGRRFLMIVLSSVVVALAIFAQRHIEKNVKQSQALFEQNNSTERKNNELFIISPEEFEKYRRDGFIKLSGILDDALVNEMKAAGDLIAKHSQKFPEYFSVVERGIIFDGGLSKVQDSDSLLGFRSAETFRKVAFASKIPEIAAQLMQLDPATQNMRVLRDLFLSKSIYQPGCDWHVDDQGEHKISCYRKERVVVISDIMFFEFPFACTGFWPESYLSSASETSGKDQDGVNVWIALDDMKKEYRGSMALSRGSHTVPWRFEAYHAIGQNRSTDGGRSKEDIIRDLEERRKTGEATLGACQINLTRPDLRALIEERGEILDVHRGDVIFSTRTLFHKTIDVTEEGARFYKSLGIDVLNRYSIRYAPGTARLPNGWMAEWSVVSSNANTARTLDEISDSDDVWYPKVWPQTEDDVDRKLDQLAEKRLNPAKERVLAEIMELFVPGGGGGANKKLAGEQEPEENPSVAQN
jgi:hypothetical protein